MLIVNIKCDHLNHFHHHPYLHYHGYWNRFNDVCNYAHMAVIRKYYTKYYLNILVKWLQSSRKYHMFSQRDYKLIFLILEIQLVCLWRQYVSDVIAALFPFLLLNLRCSMAKKTVHEQMIKKIWKEAIEQEKQFLVWIQEIIKTKGEIENKKCDSFKEGLVCDLWFRSWLLLILGTKELGIIFPRSLIYCSYKIIYSIDINITQCYFKLSSVFW